MKLLINAESKAPAGQLNHTRAAARAGVPAGGQAAVRAHKCGARKALRIALRKAHAYLCNVHIYIYMFAKRIQSTCAPTDQSALSVIVGFLVSRSSGAGRARQDALLHSSQNTENPLAGMIAHHMRRAPHGGTRGRSSPAHQALRPSDKASLVLPHAHLGETQGGSSIGRPCWQQCTCTSPKIQYIYITTIRIIADFPDPPGRTREAAASAARAGGGGACSLTSSSRCFSFSATP